MVYIKYRIKMIWLLSSWAWCIKIQFKLCFSYYLHTDYFYNRAGCIN